MPLLLPALLLTAAVGLPALWLAWSFNLLVRERTRAQNAWRQIDVQLARRHDLVPNLVEAVRGAMQFERDTLEAVVAARGRAIEVARGEARPADSAGAESQLSAALGRLITVVESHPQLRSLDQVATLQEELRTSENRIAFARQHYNDAASRYNTRRQLFPTSLLASVTDAEPLELWTAPAGSDAVPRVELAVPRPPAAAAPAGRGSRRR